MIFAHPFFGVLTTYSLLKILPVKFTKLEKKLLWIVGITASILPDVDIIYYLWCPTCSHREMLTHGLPLYALITILVVCIGLFSSKRSLWVALGSVFFANLVGHLVLDMATGGLVFFAPFSYQKHGISLDSVSGKSDWWSAYITSPWFFAELVISGLYVLLVLKIKQRLVKFLPLVYFAASVVTAWLVFS